MEEFEPLERLTADEVRGRAVSGAAILGARSALVYAVGIGANLLLARLLTPEDFGIVTLGTVIVVAGGYLAVAGAGTALIRRDAPPTRVELAAVNAFQLGITAAVVIGCAAIAAPLGRDGLIVAVMVASLPITVLRVPSVIVLERRLRYRVIATTDVVEALAYYLWAVTTVVMGFGVWGLATAVVVRAILGTATMLIMGPLGIIRPRWSWPHVRPLMGFGLMFQATVVLQIAREQGVNVAIAAIAGIATLGVWNLAWRILQIPNLLFLAVARVAYPAMSRLLGTGEDPRAVIERGLAATAAVTGIVIVGLVGFATALPVLIGDSWGDVPTVLLWTGVALIVSAPLTVSTAGYLYAAGAPGAVAMATALSSVMWLGVGIPLLPSLGAPAMGIGWAAAAMVSTAVLWRATAARVRPAIAANVTAPTAVALVATGAGWLVAQRASDNLVGGILGLAVGEALVLVGLAILSRPALRDSRSLIAQGLDSLRVRRA